jgi:FG-GAP-like repeat
MARLQSIPQLAIMLSLILTPVAQTVKPTTPSAAQADPSSIDALTEVTKSFHFPTVTRTLPAAIPYRVSRNDYSVEQAVKTLLPALGGCIAIGDYDGDGRPDLYVVLPGIPNHLFHNDGNGRFSDATEKARVAGDGNSLSATFADYDHSGHLSLFVAGLGGVELYRNNGSGTFTNVTEVAGLKTSPNEVDTAVTIFDADHDGSRDVLVTGYADLNSPPTKPSFLVPFEFGGVDSRLFRNQGNGTFVDVTAAAGLSGNIGRARKALAADFNKDGRPDVLILRENKPPVLYVNLGQGKFKDATTASGEDIWPYAFVDGQVADFNRDGKADLALWSTIAYRALLNQGNARFQDVEHVPLIRPPAGLFDVPGTVIELSDDGYGSLVGIDSNYKLQAVINRRGEFSKALTAVTVSDVSANAPWGDNKFIALMQAHLRAKNEQDLIGLRPSGELVVYRIATTRHSGG